MTLIAYGIDSNANKDITLPLAGDLTDTAAWNYPYVREAMFYGMVMPDDKGNIIPNKALNRAEVAAIIFRTQMGLRGVSTQENLNKTEAGIVGALDALGKNDVTKAQIASAQALVYARGAMNIINNLKKEREKAGITEKVKTTVVEGSLKTAQAFRAIVRAYQAGIDQNLAEVKRLADEAKSFGEQIRKLDASLVPIADQIGKISEGMKTSAVDLEKQPKQQ